MRTSIHTQQIPQRALRADDGLDSYDPKKDDPFNTNLIIRVTLIRAVKQLCGSYAVFSSEDA